MPFCPREKWRQPTTFSLEQTHAREYLFLQHLFDHSNFTGGASRGKTHTAESALFQGRTERSSFRRRHWQWCPRLDWIVLRRIPSAICPPHSTLPSSAVWSNLEKLQGSNILRRSDDHGEICGQTTVNKWAPIRYKIPINDTGPQTPR